MTEAGLLDLAAEIPAEIREALPEWETRARCLFAASLYDEAAGQEPADAEATRRKAGRVLASIPIDQYAARLAYFDTELQEAARAEDDEECGRVFAALCRLQFANIYPSADVLRILNSKLADELDYGHGAASRAARLKARG
jgi:hypothetical protein